MSRNDSTRDHNIPHNEFVLSAQDLQRWDAAQYAALNGDDGGAWTPASPIILGGAGATFSTSGTAFTGGATTTTGGRIILGANDFPQLTTPVTRSITLRLWDAYVPIRSVYTQLDEEWVALSQPPSSLGVRLARPILAYMTLAFPRRYLHQGATFAGAVLTYRITARPATLPTSRMWFQPVWRGYDGSTLTIHGLPTAFPYTSGAQWAAATAYPTYSSLVYSTTNNGFTYQVTAVSGTGTSGATEPVWPTTIGATVTDNPGANQVVWKCIDYSGVALPAASPDAYYNAGQPQTISLTATAEPSVIDGSGPYYYLQLGNIDPTAILHTVQFNFNTIGSMAFP